MSPQTMLRIYYMIATIYKGEHENVISLIARYAVNIFFRKLIYSVGERNKKRGKK